MTLLSEDFVNSCVRGAEGTVYVVVLEQLRGVHTVNHICYLLGFKQRLNLQVLLGLDKRFNELI